MGVFQVKNLASGKVFIATAKNLPGKINSCKFQLQNGSHPNRELQSDFAQCGESGFVFEILDRLEYKDDPLYNYDDDLKTLEELVARQARAVRRQGISREEKAGEMNRRKSGSQVKAEAALHHRRRKISVEPCKKELSPASMIFLLTSASRTLICRMNTCAHTPESTVTVRFGVSALPSVKAQAP